MRRKAVRITGAVDLAPACQFYSGSAEPQPADFGSALPQPDHAGSALPQPADFGSAEPQPLHFGSALPQPPETPQRATRFKFLLMMCRLSVASPSAEGLPSP